MKRLYTILSVASIFVVGAASAKNLVEVQAEGFSCFVDVMATEGFYRVTHVDARTVDFFNGHRDEILLTFERERSAGEYLFTFAWTTSQGLSIKRKPSVIHPGGTEIFYTLDCSKVD